MAVTNTEDISSNEDVGGREPLFPVGRNVN
jgi:hypothetical protein